MMKILELIKIEYTFSFFFISSLTMFVDTVERLVSSLEAELFVRVGLLFIYTIGLAVIF